MLCRKLLKNNNLVIEEDITRGSAIDDVKSANYYY